MQLRIISYYLCYEMFRNDKILISITKMEEKFIKPTEAELSILQVLWAHGVSSVRFVNEQLNLQRSPHEKEIGYTTTLKLMQLMLEKGLLQREESDGRGHLYRANVDEDDTQRHLLRRFVDATFRGSASKLVMELLGSHEASADELQEIKSLIDKLSN